MPLLFPFGSGVLRGVGVWISLAATALAMSGLVPAPASDHAPPASVETAPRR